MFIRDSCPNGYKVTDGLLDGVGLAFPSLTTFTWRQWYMDHPVATLRGLERLGQRCPNLHTITIPISFSDINPTRDKSVDFTPAPSVREVDFERIAAAGSSDLERSRFVAGVVARMWPNLQVGKTYGSEGRRVAFWEGIWDIALPPPVEGSTWSSVEEE